LAAREEKFCDDENQELATHTRNGKRRKEVHPHKKFQKSQKTQILKSIIQVINASAARRWDTLLEIVLT
jgi:hypothetical protein